MIEAMRQAAALASTAAKAQAGDGETHVDDE
jgi:hypothetical protein